MVCVSRSFALATVALCGWLGGTCPRRARTSGLAPRPNWSSLLRHRANGSSALRLMVG